MSMGKRGTIDVKLPAKTRGRGKAWKRKFVTIHPMSDLAAQKFIAKLEIFAGGEEEEEGGSTPSRDKTTLYLENVTAVKRVKSRTHPYAFVVCEDEPVIFLAGRSESEVQGWMEALRGVLWPTQAAPDLCGESYAISVIDNDDSEKLCLSGSYKLTVSPQSVCIHDPVDGGTVQLWRLNTLKRFRLAEDNLPGDAERILMIEAGVNCPTGAGVYLFYSIDASLILQAIIDNINMALQQRLQRNEGRPRTRNRTVSENTSPYGRASDTEGRAIPRNDECRSCDPVRKSLGSAPRSTGLRGSTPALDRVTPSLSYDRLLLKPNSENIQIKPKVDLTTLPTARPSSRTSSIAERRRSSVDRNGYSKLIISDLKTAGEPKDRALSTNSSVSQSSAFSNASSGVGSLASTTNPGTENGSPVRERSKSVDSAISTSFWVNLDKLHIDHSSLLHNISEHCSSDPDYQDVDTLSEPSAVPNKRRNSDPHAASGRHEVSKELLMIRDQTMVSFEQHLKRRHNSAENIHDRDHIYEDLDKFRKDLSKFLGLKNEIEPPALPERPESMRKEKEKQRRQVTASPSSILRKAGQKNKRKDKKRSTRGSKSSSSSSDDDAESVKKMPEWPLRRKMRQESENNLYNSTGELVPDQTTPEPPKRVSILTHTGASLDFVPKMTPEPFEQIVLQIPGSKNDLSKDTTNKNFHPSISEDMNKDKSRPVSSLDSFCLDMRNSASMLTESNVDVPSPSSEYSGSVFSNGDDDSVRMRVRHDRKTSQLSTNSADSWVDILSESFSSPPSAETNPANSEDNPQSIPSLEYMSGNPASAQDLSRDSELKVDKTNPFSNWADFSYFNTSANDYTSAAWVKMLRSSNTENDMDISLYMNSQEGIDKPFSDKQRVTSVLDESQYIDMSRRKELMAGYELEVTGDYAVMKSGQINPFVKSPSKHPGSNSIDGYIDMTGCRNSNTL